MNSVSKAKHCTGRRQPSHQCKDKSFARAAFVRAIIGTRQFIRLMEMSQEGIFELLTRSMIADQKRDFQRNSIFTENTVLQIGDRPMGLQKVESMLRRH
jgi:hypothetical protein